MRWPRLLTTGCVGLVAGCLIAGLGFLVATPSAVTMLDLVRGGRFGYLLKDRVLDVDDFLEALRRVAAGGSALDPEVVATLLGPRQEYDPLATLTRGSARC